MSVVSRWRIGAALAATVGAGYAVCSAIFWAFPGAAASFMNALFHGLDFSILQAPEGFTFASFVLGLVVLVAWAFAMGATFGWLAQRMAR